MDTSAASGSLNIKQEPELDEFSDTVPPPVGVDGRIIRKMTVLDPLKLKLLNRQSHNRLLSGLLTEKAKAKPPAPTTASPAPNVSSSLTITPSATADNAAESNPPVVTSTAAVTTEIGGDTAGKPSVAPTSLFRRKKVVPVAIAKKIAQKEKKRPSAVAAAAAPPEVVSESVPETKEAGTIDPVVTDQDPSESVSVPVDQPTVAVKTNSRPAAFRRIKPKVSINIAQSRPKKSILKKSSSMEIAQSGTDPDKSFQERVPVVTIVLEDGDEEENPRIEEGRDENENEKQNSTARTNDEERIETLKDVEKEELVSNQEEDIAAKKSCEIPEHSPVKSEESTNSRKAVKISPEVWKLQMQRMQNNPYWIHNALARSPEKVISAPSQDKESVIVENSEFSKSVPPPVVAQESVNVNVPEVSGATDIIESIKPAERAAPNTTREIRRISRLPPNLAMKLMNCVSLTKQKKQDATIVEPKVEEVAPQPVSEPSQDQSAPTKVIRRISHLPPDLAKKLVSSVSLKQDANKKCDTNKEVEKESQNPVAVTDERTSVELAKPTQTKEIRRISRVPANVALKLLSIVASTKRAGATSTPSTPPEAEESATMTEKKDPVVHVADQSREEANRIPPIDAQKVDSSMVQQEESNREDAGKGGLEDITESKPVPSPAIATQSDGRGQQVESSTNPNRKVHILSQVILPTASYNLEELLAGKSTETIPPDKLTLPLPRPFRSYDNKPIVMPAPLIETTKKEVDVGGDIVGDESFADVSDSAVDVGDEQKPDVQRNDSEQSLRQVQNCFKPVTVQTSEKMSNLKDEYDRRKEIMSVTLDRIADKMPKLELSKQETVEKPQVVTKYNLNSTKTDTSRLQAAPVNVNPSEISQFPHQQPVQLPIVSRQPQLRPNMHQPQPQFLPVTYQVSAAYSNHPVTVYTRPYVNPQQMVINPVNFKQTLQHQQQQPIPHHRPVFPPTQFVLVRSSNPSGNTSSTPHSSQQHLLVPRTAVFHQQPASRNNQIIIPAPRFVISPGSRQPIPESKQHSSGSRQHQQQQPAPPPPRQQQQPPIQQPQPPRQQLQPNHPSVRYIVPTISPRGHAFQPVVRTSGPIQQQQPPARVIPKIVIDSSFVENDRPKLTGSNCSASTDTGHELKNFSPCSQLIKNKLRDKLRAKILKKESSDDKDHQTISSSPSTSMAQTKPAVPRYVIPATVRVMPQHIHQPPPRQRVIYHAEDFNQCPARTPRVPPPQKPPDLPLGFKQFVYGHGKKIYLTKISVTKPAHPTNQPIPTSTTSVPVPAQNNTNLPRYLKSPSKTHHLYEDIFHGFPQSTIRSEKREFQRFRDAMEQLERNMSPASDPMTTGTAATAESQGETTFIITEFDDAPGPSTVTRHEVKETFVQHESGMPPKISFRRKTFVVDDSDCEIRTDQLPRIEESLKGVTKGEQDQVKVEDSREECDAGGALGDVKDEDSSSGELDDKTDEDLAREILAIVQKEREMLKIISPMQEEIKKVKRRKKKRKRRKAKDCHKQLLNLLMKHVNHESLIADIVSAQRKQLPSVEIPEVEEESAEEIERNVDQKQEETDEEPPEEMEHIFKQQLEEEEQKPDTEKVAEKEVTSDSVISDIELDESETDIFEEILKPFRTKNPTSVDSHENQAQLPATEPEDPIQPSEQSIAEPVIEPQPDLPDISEPAVVSPIPVMVQDLPRTPICDISALSLTEEMPKPASIAPRAPKRKLKPTLVSRSKTKKMEPDAIKVVDENPLQPERSFSPVPACESSDSCSDREDSAPAYETFLAQEIVEPPKEKEITKSIVAEVVEKESGKDIRPFVRKIVDEWDSEGGMDDRSDQTLQSMTIDIPCRITREDIQLQKLHLTVSDEQIRPGSPLEIPSEASRTTISMEETAESEPAQPVSNLERRVSVWETELHRIPEQCIIQPQDDCFTPLQMLDGSVPISKTPPRTVTNAKTSDDVVTDILRDWDSPVKKQETPQLIARVLLDRIDTTKFENRESNEATSEAPDSASINSAVISQSDPVPVHGIQELANKQPKESLHDKISQTVEVQNQPSSRTRSRRSDVTDKPIAEVIENVPKKTKNCMPSSMKNCLKNTINDPPAQTPVEPQGSKRSRQKKSVVFDQSVENKPEQQEKPAGRVLRSRSKSIFSESKVSTVEESPQKQTIEPQSVENVKRTPKQQIPPQKIQRVATEPGSNEKLVVEAGGEAGAKKREQPEKQSTKPTPFISNRIPIPISSEDEDDAPLTQRRKVLRKKRSSTRRRTIQDLNANRRLFQSAHKSSSTADDPTEASQTDFIIKTEPEEIQEYPEQSMLYNSFGPPSNLQEQPPSGRILSIVTVQNNQVVHTEDFNTSTTTPDTVHFQRPPFETTDHQAATLPASSPQDHVFATPEPIKKRKRRSKQEMEADRLANLQIKNKKSRPVPTANISSKEVKCASCYLEIPTVEWDAHYAYHNGLTYRVDIDPELDLLDETTAAQIVTRFKKSNRLSTLKCDKCGVLKKSAVGLVSHRIICGLTAEEIQASKVTCEHCKRKMLAVSLSTHLVGHCPVLKRMKREQTPTEAIQSADEEPAVETAAVVNQRGRTKRKATTTAEKKIRYLSCGNQIVSVTKATVTEGCVAVWDGEFRKFKKASCVFKDCDFAGYEEAEMREHHLRCTSTCERFECKNCRYQANNVQQLMKHIKVRHGNDLVNPLDSSGTEAKISSESSEDDGTSGVDENEIPDIGGRMSDDESGSEKVKKKPKKRTSKGTPNSKTVGLPGRDLFNDESDVYREMVLDEVIELRSSKKEFHVTSREWTIAFRRQNYSCRMLFAELRPDLDVRLFSSDLIHKYIPKCAKSVRFTMRNTNLYNAPIQVNDYTDKWQRLDTFSGQVRGTDSMFYCGGPVIALDWLPINGRERNEHQFLAVACKTEFDEFHLANRSTPSKCLIQIWDVGYLHNKSLSYKAEHSIPELLYSIACDFGPIWSLKFCPSGCYNTTDADGDPYDRLGLLAATGSDGDVYIFSLSKNYAHLISNNYRILRINPVHRLTLSTMDTSDSQYEGHTAVKVAWTKAKNHAIIAAGYSNGTVAVWNLNSKTPLLKGVKEGCPVLFPVHRIFIPDSCITALDIHYTEDSRYLLVCNADRKIQVYDLKTGYLPVEVCSMNARSKVTAACWNIHFPVIALTFDDVYAIDRCALTLHQMREIGVRLCPLYTIAAEATDMSGNDWLSNHVIGTDGGDVLCHQPIAFVHHMAQKNTQQSKYILTSTMSIQITDEMTDTSYAMFENNFGLLFSDNDKNPAKMDLKSLQVKSYRRALLHEYPGIRVNQVRWNPNEKSHQYYAVGYQAGFVRVRGFRLK
ncbi:titin-like [Topomyia yanbarensis]|uniref:titin-like n=1 Tax=Topomyia yanbarensis TaxID=2498891 RepID=UPI00273AFBF0|nr:titin-like [Topomyia yanbarensis]